MTPLDFWQALTAYCALVGGSVTSYGRTQEHNARVGGVPLSGHLFWLAADVVYDDATRARALPRADFARRLGLRLIAESDHDHLQPWAWPPG